MKNNSAITFLVMLIGAFLSGLYGPWWAPSVFVVISTAIIGLKSRQGMIIGACAIGIVFLGMAVWMAMKDQEHIIEKTGTLLGGLSPVAMIAVTTLIGLMTGLLAGWLGSALGGVLKKERSTAKV